MLGTRQSGLAQFRVARLPEDAELLDGAREIGSALLDADPELALPEHALLDWAVRAARRRRRARPDPAREPVRVIAGPLRRAPAAGAAGRAPDAAHLRPRPRGAVLDPRRARRRTRVSRPVRRLGRARPRGAVARRRAGDVRRQRAAPLARSCGPTSRRSAPTPRWCAPTRRVAPRRIRRGAPIRSRVPRSALPAGGGAGSRALGTPCPRCWGRMRWWSPSPTAARRSS